MVSNARPDNSIPEVKWYYRPVSVLIVFLVAGPFVIPLVWLSPAFKRWQKIVITVIVAIFTAWAFKAAADIYRLLLKDLQDLQAAMK